jgi:parallel beta-helix repeat protein
MMLRSSITLHSTRLPLVLALVLGLIVFAPNAARAAGPACTVGSAGADYTTIQAAVSDTACATIAVAAGVYAEHVTIGRDVTISGAGASSTVVDGTNTGRVFIITSGAVTLDKLTIANGKAAGSDFSSNTGGGIYIQKGSVTVSNSTVSGNSASGNGGGIYPTDVGRVTVSNSTISGNSASGNGGGIYKFFGGVTVSNSTISGNSATDGGGV